MAPALVEVGGVDVTYGSLLDRRLLRTADNGLVNHFHSGFPRARGMRAAIELVLHD
jgi:methionyl-tRNA formyltransferase